MLPLYSFAMRKREKGPFTLWITILTHVVTAVYKIRVKNENFARTRERLGPTTTQTYRHLSVFETKISLFFSHLIDRSFCL